MEGGGEHRNCSINKLYDKHGILLREGRWGTDSKKQLSLPLIRVVGCFPKRAETILWLCFYKSIYLHMFYAQKLLFLVHLCPCKTNDRAELKKGGSRLSVPLTVLPQAFRTNSWTGNCPAARAGPSFLFQMWKQVAGHSPVPCQTFYLRCRETMDEQRQWNGSSCWSLSHRMCLCGADKGTTSFVCQWLPCSGASHPSQSQQFRNSEMFDPVLLLSHI